MDNLSSGERAFRQRHGHASMCNCVRRFQRRLIVNTRRTCSCDVGGMTRKKAYDQALQELGPMTKDNHQSIVKRIQKIERDARAGRTA